MLCSGCTAQWIVNLAGIDIGTSSGAVDRSVHVATGDCLLSFKISHYVFLTGGDILQIPRFSWVILVYVFHYIMYTLSGFLVRKTTLFPYFCISSKLIHQVTFLTVERFFAVSQPLKYNTADINQHRRCQMVHESCLLKMD